MSAELGRPVAEAHPVAAHAHEAEAGPSMAVYLLTGLATFIITAIEVLIVNMEGMKPILIPLMGINFGIAALFYQGLWYEKVEYKVIFATGVALGVVTVIGLAAMLPLGLGVK